MKVVVTDCDFSDLTIERGVLEPEIEVVLAGSRDPERIAELASDADGVLVQYASIDGPLLSRLGRLKAVVRYGIGLDNVDVAAAERLGIRVSNVPDYCVDEVSEHALAMILQVSRRLLDYSRSAANDWSTRGIPVPSLNRSQTVGIVGMGRIGRRLAELVTAVGFSVLYHDAYSAQTDWGTSLPLKELPERSDHLSLHVPLTDETHHLVSDEVLRSLGPTGHLINTSRGRLVNEEALLRALDAGALGWASLDVLGTEPPSGVSAALLSHPKVVVSPHVAYLSDASLIELPRRAAEIMKRLLSLG